ncbi:DUF1775 domain-containing protein [Streptomyces sp. TS71-3]|uniref:DUF1775 domain-containing protein n=1 Tax=Streptomyces sp. TS71-3 TaxID=2733862 RepID=UPI001B27B68C|nr:DUF1775 domain-containing protein [Streptomyces sp. TS71-3]GHJ41300.1 hypothetical protein Sm713_69090 [Streptomyces sp. TS71-3]
MSRTPRQTSRARQAAARRLPLAAGAAAIALLLSAGPALAHVEVTSDKQQAGAENATISFDAEAESDSAGITGLRVVLPEGVAPADVTYGEGPAGWKFKATDDGYTVGGPAVKVGESAKYSVVVKQLPDAGDLAFKTLQTYGDGHTDRWIELDENSEHPAPHLKLRAAVAGSEGSDAQSGPSASESGVASQPPAGSSPSPGAAQKDENGLPTGAWLGIAAAVLVLAGAGYTLRSRYGRRA